MVGDIKSDPPRGKTMIWRAQMALYLVGRVRPSPLMEVVTKGTTKRALISVFESTKHNDSLLYGTD